MMSGRLRSAHLHRSKGEGGELEFELTTIASSPCLCRRQTGLTWVLQNERVEPPFLADEVDGAREVLDGREREDVAACDELLAAEGDLERDGE